MKISSLAPLIMNNATFVAPASVTLTATASDTDGTVGKVEFFEGANLLATVTSAPYTFNWTNVAQGSYTLFAKATDNLNAVTTSTAINVTVNANQLPTVTLTSPANNATAMAPATITLTATATDTDGTIAKLEFLSGSTVVATLTSAPFTFDLTNVAAGGYTFTARATDDKNGVTTSSPVSVTVTSAVASVFYIYTDHLNTPRAITNEANTTVWQWDNVDPFGNNPANEDADGDGIKFTYNPRFPGQYFDKETNLHYNHFRSYDPANGRFVESDPIGLGGGINTYGYVAGNPLSQSDLDGLCGWPCGLGVGVIAVATGIGFRNLIGDTGPQAIRTSNVSESRIDLALKCAQGNTAACGQAEEIQKNQLVPEIKQTLDSAKEATDSLGKAAGMPAKVDKIPDEVNGLVKLYNSCKAWFSK